MARVFRQKLKSLINYIVKLEVFGSVRCWMYSVEWQRRSLPHGHILIWLHYKITSNEIDDVISAEIPDENVDKGLYDIVVKNMMHGPCGALNEDSPCMAKGRCTKQYPRLLVSNTITGNDGYPQYRRKSTEDGGKTAIIKKLNGTTFEVDNQWVVPYSPLLSKTFNTHINVKYCNSVKAIKYICKYVSKSSVMAVFGLQSEIKDIQLPAEFCNLVTSKNELIEKVFPNILNNYKNNKWLSERAILVPKNIDVHEINNIVLTKIRDQAVLTYESVDTVLEPNEAVNYPSELLNSLDLSGFPPHVLQLKIGVSIILLRNIKPPKLCYGTRLAVKKKKTMENVIEATTLTGPFVGEAVLIPRIPMIPTDLPFQFKRLQFPIGLAFAITINKAQGQSLEKCDIDLNTDCFPHGQLYVACSRVGKPDNRFICSDNRTAKNVVYSQVLRS